MHSTFIYNILITTTGDRNVRIVLIRSRLPVYEGKIYVGKAVKSKPSEADKLSRWSLNETPSIIG